MTDQHAFSQDEWRTIRSTPLVAGLAVARATRSGLLGGLDELRTLLGDIGRTDPDLTDTELVTAIIADHPRWHLARLTGADTADPEAMLADAVATCHTVRDLLADRATGEEREQFRSWVVSIAHDVATACREGGADTTDAERAAIAAIEAALTATR